MSHFLMPKQRGAAGRNQNKARQEQIGRHLRLVNAALEQECQAFIGLYAQKQQEIDDLHKQLAQLQEWETKLIAARNGL